MKIEYYTFGQARFTLKELQITSKLRDGLPHKLIADCLLISHGTVDHRVSTMLHKAQVKNSKELVALAVEQGMERNGIFRGINLFAKPRTRTAKRK